MSLFEDVASVDTGGWTLQRSPGSVTGQRHAATDRNGPALTADEVSVGMDHSSTAPASGGAATVPTRRTRELDASGPPEKHKSRASEVSLAARPMIKGRPLLSCARGGI